LPDVTETRDIGSPTKLIGNIATKNFRVYGGILTFYSPARTVFGSGAQLVLPAVAAASPQGRSIRYDAATNKLLVYDTVSGWIGVVLT